MRTLKLRFSYGQPLLLVVGASFLPGAHSSSFPVAASSNVGVTLSNFPGIGSPDGVTTGPDGALWFTNLSNNSIGRITTSGVNTNFTARGIDDPRHHRRP